MIYLNGIFCFLSLKLSRKYDVLKAARDEKLLYLVYLEEKIGGRRSETYIAADVDAS